MLKSLRMLVTKHVMHYIYRTVTYLHELYHRTYHTTSLSYTVLGLEVQSSWSGGSSGMVYSTSTYFNFNFNSVLTFPNDGSTFKTIDEEMSICHIFHAQLIWCRKWRLITNLVVISTPSLWLHSIYFLCFILSSLTVVLSLCYLSFYLQLPYCSSSLPTSLLFLFSPLHLSGVHSSQWHEAAYSQLNY